MGEGVWFRVIGRGRAEGRATGRERDPALGEAEEAAQRCVRGWPAGRLKGPCPQVPKASGKAQRKAHCLTQDQNSTGNGLPVRQVPHRTCSCFISLDLQNNLMR